MKRFFKGLGYAVLVLFVLLNVMCAFHAYKLTHFYDPQDINTNHLYPTTAGEKLSAVLFGVKFPKRIITEQPRDLPVQNIEITTEDGLRLQGWYSTNPIAKGTVILFHGHGGNREGVLTEAKAFDSLGYNICMIDFRAHGNSGGNECTIGYKESKDVKATYDFVAAKGEKNIIMYGISLGAATITKALVDYPDIHASKIILDMPYGSLPDAVKGRLRLMGLPVQPFAFLLTFWGGLEHGFWAFNMRPSDFATKINVPTLLQRGKQDVRVTEAETKAIYNNLGSPQKQLVIYNFSHHQSLLKKEREKWISSVSEFLK